MIAAAAVKIISGVAGFLGLSSAISTVTGALSGLIPVFTAVAGAISLPVLAIAALGAAIVGLIFNIGGFRDKVISALKYVAEAFKFTFTGIKDLITNFASTIWQHAVAIGSSIVNGIKQGLSNLWGTLKNALISPVENAINWIKEKLKIGSPSKVFEEIGESIVEGYGEGLKLAEKIKPTLPAPTLNPVSPTPVTTAAARPYASNITIRLEGVAIREDKDIDKLADEIEKRIGRKLRW